MLARRLLMFALILLVITAISTALAPPPQRSAVSPPAKTDDPSPTGDARVISRTIDASRANPATVEVEAGDLLELTVTSDEAGSIELRDLGQVKILDPTTDAVFDVIATDPGLYPIVLLGAERTVGTVRVTPREG